ncbi:hypothetical protein PUR71_09330 [Streptomyces sp. SP17BM10]|uniref:hypothetical protein n=1 Tax=Streptomyces sp. SP17BM10 TaxID=3002530 RepID=UPI002E7621C3|nr:hypothetical protein [Streptomyces sp. SP17BM10]MEE1783117.1 hypothetical protein [Streptomyces sp. SP17BM10]
MVYQQDGNLVEYDLNGNPIWKTDTAGTAPGKVIMQYDGNLVVYDAFQRPQWSSRTDNGCSPSANWLRIQDDRNVVIYRPHGDGPWTPVWSSLNGTVGSC